MESIKFLIPALFFTDIFPFRIFSTTTPYPNNAQSSQFQTLPFSPLQPAG